MPHWLLEGGAVLRCGGGENLADAGQHQGAERVVEHRLAYTGSSCLETVRVPGGQPFPINDVAFQDLTPSVRLYPANPVTPRILGSFRIRIVFKIVHNDKAVPVADLATTKQIDLQ